MRLAKARSKEIEKRGRASTAIFHGLQVTQRPTFVLDSNIGDRAVFSGFWRVEPLIAAIESMLGDATAYQSWRAHVGEQTTGTIPALARASLTIAGRVAMWKPMQVYLSD